MRGRAKYWRSMCGQLGLKRKKRNIERRNLVNRLSHSIVLLKFRHFISFALYMQTMRLVLKTYIK